MSEPAHILIVEDESIVAKDIQSSLIALGYKVAGMVASGEEAVEQSMSLRPDLVLMDVMLKGGMDGIEAAERICASTRIPVVYLTAYTDDDTLRRAKVSEAFGYLLKPFEDRELRTTIEMALYKHTMERKLRESREWLETTMRCMGDAVIATDLSASVQLVNRQAELLTGWRQEEAVGRRLPEIFCFKAAGENENGRADVDALLTGAAEFHGVKDVLLVARDGRQTSVDYTAAPIRESDGRILGVVIICRDITDLKKAADRERGLHERLARSKRMESLGTLADGVAHDLNSILGPIVGYPDLIMKSLPAESAIRADLEIIKNSASKAVDIIRDLLTLGRTGHIPLKPINFNTAVSGALKALAGMTTLEHAPMVNLKTHLADDSGLVMGSERHLHELVVNLVLNAYAIMPQGGCLELTTSVEHLETALDGYETVPPGAYMALRVKDTGMGFAEDDISRIFEPFYIKKKLKSQAGTGLGMAVVYGVVKEHNGFVDIQSQSGAGACFSIFLPLAGAVEPSAPAPMESPDCRGTETVMIVDDDEEQRRFSARWLRSLGYKVLTAHNGAVAVELFADELEGGRRVDIVAVDMIMADEMDGLETYRKMLELCPGQRAVMISGFAVTDRLKEAFKLGAGQYLQKPYTLDELGQSIRKELDRGN